MDKRRVVLLLLVIVLSIFYTDTVKAKVAPGLEAVRSAAVTDAEEGFWKEIKDYLGLITRREIATGEFYLYGSEKGYEKVLAVNDGYLPLYNNKTPDIIEAIVPASNMHIRPGRNRTATKYVVIHNTGMASPKATAPLLSRSINNSTREASWHFTVDDHEIYQQLGIDEVGWHAGAREGNEYGIGIEICSYQGIDFNGAMRNAAKLTAKLLIDYDLGLDAVKQHYDFSRKNCPQVLREANRWDEFLDLVKIEYLGQTKFSAVDFKWRSLSPKDLDDAGRIIGAARTVHYEAKVTYNGETRVYKFTSNVK
ncbi:MAG TPA: hypothetical protein GX390_04940 [Acholeplasmataceae bacterium]|nr:hypothetical protein [Acholeplasmataceae bacterium]